MTQKKPRKTSPGARPSMPDDRNRFIDCLDAMLARPMDVMRFSSSSPDAVCVHPCFRLSVVTRGVVEYELSEGGRIISCQAREGDVLACLPWGRSRHHGIRPGARYEILAGVFWPTHIRLVRFSPERVTHYHTARPVGPDGWACVAALTHMADQPVRQQAAHMAAALWWMVRDRVAEEPVVAESGGAQEMYRRMLAYIAENFHRPIDRNGVARALSITPQYATRLFARAHGMGMNVYLRSLRVQHAERLLLDTDQSIEAVARQSGYAGAAYFIREFRRVYGVTPGRYRSAMRRGLVLESSVLAD